MRIDTSCFVVPADIAEQLNKMTPEEAHETLVKNTIDVVDSEGTSHKVLALDVENGELVSKVGSTSEELLQLHSSRMSLMGDINKDRKLRRMFEKQKRLAIREKMDEIRKSGKTPLKVGDTIEIFDIDPVSVGITATIIEYLIYDLILLALAMLEILPTNNFIFLILYSIVNARLGIAVCRNIIRELL